MKVPARHDMVPIPGDLDQESAWKRFGGLDLSQAYDLFKEDALLVCEDLAFMGLPAFDYYVIAACRYLASEDSRGDEEMMVGFVTACESQRCFDVRALERRAAEIIGAVKEVLARGEVFSEPYRNTDKKLRRLLMSIEAEPGDSVEQQL